MIEIGINKVTKNYGFKNVLNSASLEIFTGDRAAIIGRNGVGKSTILKLIAGEEAPGQGEISLRRGARVGVLEQIPRLRPAGVTVEQVLMEPFAQLFRMERRLRELETEMSRAAEKGMTEYAELQEQYALKGGYDIEERSSKVIQGFRLSALLDREYNVLSGGQKTVVNLAAAVLPEPDILLLDEPTNHLDVETLQWFEGFLGKYRGTVVMVSHDRWFLDRVATRTIVLEDGRCKSFPGGYSRAMELREQELMAEFEQYKNQQKKIDAMKASIKRFREWGARNKNNPSFYRKAKELEKRLEKMELLERPREKNKLPIQFSGARTGSDVLKLTDFSLAFGEQALFDRAGLLIREKDRVCLLGGNGTGKTSLVRAILGEIPYKGEIRINPGARIGYIPQEIRFTPEDATVLETLRREHPCTQGQARGLLARFLFPGEDVFKRAGSLSGGEKVLLKLAILLQRQVNLLILDEPTNHIDIETRETLEDALEDYGGTLLFVSHDRYFIGKTANRIALVRGGKIQCFQGDCSGLLSQLNRETGQS